MSIKHPNRPHANKRKSSDPDFSIKEQVERKDIGEGETKHISRKRRQKRPDFRFTLSICPHCDATLKEKPKEKNQASHYWFARDYEPECHECGAKKIEDGCPACHLDSWMSKDFLFKHQGGYCNCGFVGRKKYQGNDNHEKQSDKKLPARRRLTRHNKNT